MRYHHIAKTAALMLLIVLLLPLASCTGARPTRIALILSSDSGHYWENIIEGAQTAAQRMDVELVCYAPDDETHLFLEDLPLQAVEEGAEALIVASKGEVKLIEELKMMPHIPIFAVGTALTGLQTEAKALNNNAQMGKSMAMVLEQLDRSEPRSVLLLADTAEYQSTDVCEYNLRRDMFAQGIRVSGRFFTGDNRDWAYRQTLQYLYLHPELDAVVAFSAQATVGAARAVEYLGREVIVVGTDIVPEMITYIESGRVAASVMRNSFGMGYLGVEFAVKYMEDEPLQADKTLDSVVVSNENLFTPEIEKIVFPFE